MDAYLRTLGAEDFIYTALNLLKDDSALGEKALAMLTDADFCAAAFGLPCAALKEIPFVGEIAAAEYLDAAGDRLYYPHPQFYKVNERRFLVCCLWEGKQEAFINWMHTV